jgi:hypothetical protein
MDIAVVALIVFAVQVVTGIGAVVSNRRAIAARRASDPAADILGEISAGGATIKFDKSDVLSVAFAIFVFWAVGNKTLAADQALGAFVAVISGTGVKELIQAVFRQ